MVTLFSCDQRDNALVSGTARSQKSDAKTSVAAPTARSWAILINGGGEASKNYQSHLLHIERMARLLVDGGVDKDRIAIFASDGDDPRPDLAVLDRTESKHPWLLADLAEVRRLRPSIGMADSKVPGFALYPAKTDAIAGWIRTRRGEFQPGDVLFVYVTDHGRKNRTDLSNNAIVLWEEDLSVRNFARLFSMLPEKTSVVAAMSQCFSGSFANVIYETGSGANQCGYYAAEPHRFAYGCYPENRGRDNVGHGFRFIEALGSYGNLVDAHNRTLLTDRTPDVPYRSSNFYLAELVSELAQAEGRSIDETADELLDQAWLDEVHYNSELADLDRLSGLYGLSSPRSLTELDAETQNLPDLASSLDEHAGRWARTASDRRRRWFREFLAASPDWDGTLEPSYLDELPENEKAELFSWLERDFHDFVKMDAIRYDELKSLAELATETRRASYRMEVRYGAARRVRFALLSIAGTVYVDRYGSAHERAKLERLRNCENAFHLDFGSRPRRHPGEVLQYPTLAEETALAKALIPSWFGVTISPPSSTERRDLALEPGARKVRVVEAGSPAEIAGLTPGDILLGPPNAHFENPGDLEAWAATANIDRRYPLEFLRGGRLFIVDVEFVPAPN